MQATTKRGGYAMFTALVAAGAARAQTAAGDTSLVFSITVAPHPPRAQDGFPDVYPDVDHLLLATRRDTVPCRYEFPFLLRAHTYASATCRALPDRTCPCHSITTR